MVIYVRYSNVNARLVQWNMRELCITKRLIQLWECWDSILKPAYGRNRMKYKIVIIEERDSSSPWTQLVCVLSGTHWPSYTEEMSYTPNRAPPLRFMGISEIITLQLLSLPQNALLLLNSNFHYSVRKNLARDPILNSIQCTASCRVLCGSLLLLGSPCGDYKELQRLR
jgi:hypothetical protein